nr:MAG TPA: hypothetical protein [Caudoviricetes sp.]
MVSAIFIIPFVKLFTVFSQTNRKGLLKHHKF